MKKTWLSAKIIGRLGSEKSVLMTFGDPNTMTATPEAEANYLRIMQEWCQYLQTEYPDYTVSLEIKSQYTLENCI